VVWTIPSPCPGPGRVRASGDPGFRCCPSSLYTFPFPGLARDCRREVSPSLGSSASAVSRGALKCSSPLRLPFRHARVAAKAIPTPPGVAKAIGPAPRRHAKNVLTRPFSIVYKLSKKLLSDYPCRLQGSGSGTLKAGNIECAPHQGWPCKSLLIWLHRLQCTKAVGCRQSPNLTGNDPRPDYASTDAALQ
jgi:hypothetical protein